ncbi:hypothetical protein OROMI_007804 [Orobanche minor]
MKGRNSKANSKKADSRLTSSMLRLTSRGTSPWCC